MRYMVIINYQQRRTQMEYTPVSFRSDKHVFELFQDLHATSPRQRDWNEGTISLIYTVGHKYSIGDDENLVKDALYIVAKKLGISTYERSTRQLIEAIIASKNKLKDKYIFIKPLYVYDHSGVTYSTTPFSCRWDSGQCGWIFTVAEEFKRVGLKWSHEVANENLKSELKEYDNYQQGNCWGFSINEISNCGSCDTEHNESIECVSGFIGDYDDVTKQIVTDYLSGYPDLVAVYEKQSS